MNALDLFITGKALSNLGFTDESIDNHGETIFENEEVADQFRNVCARLHYKLDDRLNNACAALNCHKRKFIELAIADAVDRAFAKVKELHDFQEAK